LNDTVPEKIREHFETTKNLLLYSWFVYRFIPVAEFHAATTLEYALKERTDGKIKGLYRLIDHAVSKGWVKNEGFSNWQHRERMRDVHWIIEIIKVFLLEQPILQWTSPNTSL